MARERGVHLTGGAGPKSSSWRKVEYPASRTDTANANSAANADAAAAAVRGMGGVGKSVLAQQYTWESRERYHGVWWLRAEARDTLLDDPIALGTRFNPGIAEMPGRAAAAQTVPWPPASSARP